jgi:choline dehydrogenase-like flavoprotein
MENQFDVIVIGSGISGGWAAKEFCDLGFKTLVLERGRFVEHISDYPTAMKESWEMEQRGALTAKTAQENPVLSRCYAYSDFTQHLFVPDNAHPYVQEKPFDWIRGYHLGGKGLMWARQVQRWSNNEFTSPGRDGYGSLSWPIAYKDLAPWYAHVEKFIGVSGNKDGLDEVPDGEFLKAWEMNAAETSIKEKIKTHFPERTPIIGRCAHLTEVKEIHKKQGRNACMARTRCERGCPLGAYFSSNSSTLPWAEKTGNLTIHTNQIVAGIVYDPKTKKASGVETIDRHSKKKQRFSAKVIFVNAATINTNAILLNSTSEAFPNGLGNSNGNLGKYLAFHNYRGKVNATFKGNLDSYYYGRRPTSIMIPNFRNIKGNDVNFKGGYLVNYTASREGWGRTQEGGDTFGTNYIERAAKPGPWSVHMYMQGETIPVKENEVCLSQQVDPYGIPSPVLNVGYTANDEKMIADFLEQASQMLRKAGCENIQQVDSKQAPGLDIHEMGGARMGEDPSVAVTNAHNQLHDCKNVFVTDGACMTSTGTKNPSLTFMAMTARAANFAADQMKQGLL